MPKRLLCTPCVILLSLVFVSSSKGQDQEDAKQNLLEEQRAAALQQAFEVRAQIELQNARNQKAAIRAEMLPALPAFPIEALGPAGFRATSRSHFSLQTLSKAKYDAKPNGANIIFMVDRYRAEKQTRTITIRKMEQQKQTETITDEDGNTKEVVRIVAVPVAEEREQEYTVRVPAGKKPTAVPLDQVEFYHLDGTKAEKEEIEKSLDSLTPVFLLQTDPARVHIQPANELIREVVKPGTLLAVTAALRQRIAPVP
ncbi:MAG: hypothetical protein AAF483_03470 [Planctomycetota bacterium]